MKNNLNFKFFSTLIFITILFFHTEILANDNSEIDKTKNDVDMIIEEIGITTPDWWDSIEVSIPEILDMNWPVQTGFQQGIGGFGGRGGQQRGFGNRGGRGTSGIQFSAASNQDNLESIDRYLVQVIYPNSNRYKEGIKLVNHLMIINQDDRQKLIRSLNTLGDMFYELLGDYARAAFWWKKSAQIGSSIDSLRLAHCYFELGSKSAAYEILSNASSGYRGSNKEAIKFWANMGEVDKALEMIESGSQSNMGGRNTAFGGRSIGDQGIDYLFAAEICRTAGRYDQAIGYYEKLLSSTSSNNFNNFRSRGGNSTDRAKANMEAVKLFNQLDIEKVPDGTYSSSATGFGGVMYLNVTVTRGRIASVEVTQHRETYSYYSRAIPVARKIVSKQGIKGVDAVSGATITSDAIINAVVKALANAAQ